MKPLAVVSTAVVLTGILFFERASQEKPQVRAATGDAASAPTWFKVVFGVDQKDAAWDGTLAVSGGRVYEIDSWSFEARDQLKKEERAWTARTAILDGRRATYAEPTRGLLVKVDASRKTSVKVETKQGTFEFSPREISLGRPAKFLDGRATVEVLGFGDLVAETETDDDFPAIAVDSRGHRHVLWQAYDDVAKRDWLLIRDVDSDSSLKKGSDPLEGFKNPSQDAGPERVRPLFQRAGDSKNDGAKPVPVFDAKEFADPHLFFLEGTGKEQLVAVFASPGENQDWDIYAAWRTSQGWSPQRLCSAEGSDIHLAADAGPDGSLWVAWQSMRNGNGDIFARRYDNGRWSDELAVTSTAADEWEPSISVAQNGLGWIGYDSYASGNYDVHVVPIYFGAGEIGNSLKAQKSIAVATSPDFEAHASVLADDETGGVWVAYDAAQPNWGKDYTRDETLCDGNFSATLHAYRRIELRVVTPGGVYDAPVPVPQVLPDSWRAVTKVVYGTVMHRRSYDLPHLATDSGGNLWLTYRLNRQGYLGHPPGGGVWEIETVWFDGRRWSDPVFIPHSRGRNDQRIGTTLDGQGR
ncbi:MAG: hypothetical protein H8E37_02960, partial [Planctomycetes bacterium]|nr:hypothetical protein [Planctomycetota bacterium]